MTEEQFKEFEFVVQLETTIDKMRLVDNTPKFVRFCGTDLYPNHKSENSLRIFHKPKGSIVINVAKGLRMSHLPNKSLASEISLDTYIQTINSAELYEIY